jgi:hypothetical protein
MKIQIGFVLLVFSLIIAVHPQRVTAKTMVFSETFDSPNVFDQWTVVRNRQWQYPLRVCMNLAQPAQWEVVDDTAQIVIDSKPCVMEIVPNNFSIPTLENYLFAIDVTFLESINMDRNLLFLWVDENNWYDIKVTNNEIRLQKVVNGQVYELANAIGSFPFTIDQPYRVEVLLSQQMIRLSIDGALILTIADSLPFIEAESLKIGLEAGVGSLKRSVSRFDNLIVYLLDDSDLVPIVPHVKQSDPNWAEFEYDHAHEWSNKLTIRNWGCALTSLVMIMQYHGITRMPDGTALTPASLNDWLKLQPDGYIGDGLVNFLATTRLTKQLSNLFNTPALEYGRYNWNSTDRLNPAISEITNHRPVMVQIPGHFMVADGFSDDQSDLTIKDPAYTYSLLSQHQVDPLSFRTFFPSHTDLSYLFFVYDPDIQVSIVGQNNESAVEIEEQISAFSDDGATESTGGLKTTSIAKPIAGQYLVTIQSATNKELEFTAYSYDQNGEVTKHVVSKPNLGLSQTFVLDYQTSFPSTIYRVSSFTQFRLLLEKFWYDQKFTTPLAWWWLDKTANTAIHNPAETAYFKRYLANLLGWYANSMDQEILAELQQELAIIPE